jgi:hypothetical protein
VVGNRLWIVTSRCEVLCLDTEGMANGNEGPYTDEAKYMVKDTPKEASPVETSKQDADILWRYDMMDELGVFPHNASNSSVLMVDGILYICTSNGQDWTHVNIPSPTSPSFIALDAKTGKLVGEDNVGVGPRIFHGQWTSPSTGKVGGHESRLLRRRRRCAVRPRRQAAEGRRLQDRADPPGAPLDRDEDKDTDYLKKVFWADLNPPEYKADKSGKPYKYPAAEGPSEINSTPVFYKNRVYVRHGPGSRARRGRGPFGAASMPPRPVTLRRRASCGTTRASSARSPA